MDEVDGRESIVSITFSVSNLQSFRSLGASILEQELDMKISCEELAVATLIA